MRSLEAALLLPLLAALAAAQLIDPPPRIERLDNGLRVAIVEDHSLPLVSVQLWYRVGAAYDALESPGLCHLVRTILEHRDDAALELRAAGVRFESRTLRDACYFSSVLPPNFLDYVLDIEARRMKPLTVTPETIERGLEVAAREPGVNPYDLWQPAPRPLLAAMFPNHPYQHPPGLVAANLKDLKPVDVNEFINRWIVPGNATLLIVGDLSAVSVLETVRAKFDALAWREPPRPPETPTISNEQVRMEVLRLNQPGLTIAWRTPAMGLFENAAIDVLMHGLLNEFDGPLYSALRGAGSQSSTVRWRRDAWRHDGLLTLSLVLQPTAGGAPASAEKPAEIKRVLESWLKLVLQHLEQAETRVPDPIAHNRAQGLAEREVWQHRMTLGSRARDLARHQVIAGDLLLAEYSVPRVRHVAVADVQAAAHLLNRTRRVIIEYDNEKQRGPPPIAAFPASAHPHRLDAAALIDLFRTHAPGAPAPQTPTPHPRVRSTALNDRITITTVALPAPQRATLAFLSRWPEGAHRRILLIIAPQLAPSSRQGARGRMIDYAAYHAVIRQQAIALDSHGSSVGEVATAEPQRALAMLEWFAKIIPAERAGAFRRPASSLPIEVFSIGEIKPDSVTSVLRPALAGILGAAAADQKRQPDPRPPPNREVPKLEITHSPSQALVNFVNVLIHWPAAQRRTLLTPLETRALSLLLGRVPLDAQPRDPLHNPVVDGESTTLRRGWSLSDQAISTSTKVDPADLERTVRAFYGRFEAIRKRTLPSADFAVALRLARAERLVRLDGPTAIIEELAWSGSDPWIIDGEFSPEQLVQRLSLACKEAALLIDIVGGDPATVQRLRELERTAGNKSRAEPP